MNQVRHRVNESEKPAPAGFTTKSHGCEVGPEHPTLGQDIVPVPREEDIIGHPAPRIGAPIQAYHDAPKSEKSPHVAWAHRFAYFHRLDGDWGKVGGPTHRRGSVWW